MHTAPRLRQLSEGIRTYPNLSELIGINPIASDWLRLVPIDSDNPLAL